MSTPLTYEVLSNAISDGSAAFRLRAELEAVSPKVFPPTYEGGKYATETRRIGGNDVPCVLLDSVASQANRMELALQDAWEGGEIELPVVSSDFSDVENPAVVKVTSLQAPHRIADAILRDSYLPGKEKSKGMPFRKTEIGKELDQLSNANATPLLKYAPHCLVLGMWDSTGPRGGLGVKFARAMVSEIVGVQSVDGKKTASRIDPLNIRANSGVLYHSSEGWTLDEKSASKEKGKALKLGKDGKPSEANHGNIPPSISAGGFTIDYAEQTTVLSLPALRRLRFPAKPGDKRDNATDLAARTYLAALALLGATLAIDSGYDLRSRCVLRATKTLQWELLGVPGAEAKLFTLSRKEAIELYVAALNGVPKTIPIHLKEIKLIASDDLVTLVKKSMELAATETEAT